MSTSLRALSAPARILIAATLCILLLSHAPRASAINPPYVATHVVLPRRFFRRRTRSCLLADRARHVVRRGRHLQQQCSSEYGTHHDLRLSGLLFLRTGDGRAVRRLSLDRKHAESERREQYGRTRVWAYQDAANYREVIFSASGTASLRLVVNGVATTVASSRYPGSGQNVWFNAVLIVDAGTSTVKVNGVEILTRVATPNLLSGQAGFSTHNALAKFDNFGIETPVDLQPFQESFSGGTPQNLTPDAGQWSVAGGTYNSGTVQQTSVTLAAQYSAALRSRGIRAARTHAESIRSVWQPGGPGLRFPGRRIR